MAIKYAYHPGNVSHSSSPEVAVTMESFARAMGITLVPLPGATSLEQELFDKQIADSNLLSMLEHLPWQKQRV